MSYCDTNHNIVTDKVSHRSDQNFWRSGDDAVNPSPPSPYSNNLSNPVNMSARKQKADLKYIDTNWRNNNSAIINYNTEMFIMNNHIHKPLDMKTKSHGVHVNEQPTDKLQQSQDSDHVDSLGLEHLTLSENQPTSCVANGKTFEPNLVERDLHNLDFNCSEIHGDTGHVLQLNDEKYVTSLEQNADVHNSHFEIEIPDTPDTQGQESLDEDDVFYPENIEEITLDCCKKLDSQNNIRSTESCLDEIDTPCVKQCESVQGCHDELASPCSIPRTLSLNDIEQMKDCKRDRAWSGLATSCFDWTIPDPGSQKLNWNKPPLTVLVVKKMFDEGALSAFKQLVIWLVEAKNMVVFVEKSVSEDTILRNDVQFSGLVPKLQIFDEKRDDLTNRVDFIICLGGDGTLLYASSLFQASVPPVMAFNLGSLGFLTPFNFVNFKENVTNVLEGHAMLLLRYRLKCSISSGGRSGTEKTLVKKTDSNDSTSFVRTSLLVFNEVVVDRGQSSYLTNLDLYVEGRLVTSAQGDGIIISTPTGSTAYAVAAGASMVHPNVPAIVITPICPHSLSFRPVVVPAGVEIKIMVSPDSRNTAWVSFDGRDRQKMLPGECVRITTAQYPVPSVCAKDQIDDWFDSLAECLHWNVRRTQKPMSSVSSVASLDSLADQNDLSN